MSPHDRAPAQLKGGGLLALFVCCSAHDLLGAYSRYSLMETLYFFFFASVLVYKKRVSICFQPIDDSEQLGASRKYIPIPTTVICRSSCRVRGRETPFCAICIIRRHRSAALLGEKCRRHLLCQVTLSR